MSAAKRWGTTLTALVVLCLPLAAVQPAAAAQAKYLGGVRATAGVYTDAGLCTDHTGTPAAPCTRTVKMKYRTLEALPTVAMAWIEVEGVASGGTDGWTVYLSNASPARYKNVSGKPGAAAATSWFNEAGDQASGCSVDDSSACKAFPFAGAAVPTPGTPGVKVVSGDSGGTTGGPGKLANDTWPRVRLVLFTGKSDSPYETSGWLTPTTTDQAPITDALVGTPGTTPGESLTPEDPAEVTSGDEDADAACGAWWHLPCHLGRLFIPSGGPVEDLQSAYEGSLVQTLTLPISALTETVDGLKTGIEHDFGVPLGGCGEGGQGDPETTTCTRAGYSRCSGPTVTVPLGAEEEDFEFRPLDGCDNTEPMGMVRGPVRLFLKVVLYVLAAFGLLRLVGGAFGISFSRGGDE